MSKALFESVTFEPESMPTIAAGSVFNGFPAFAYLLGQADEFQAYLMYKGPCHTVFSGSSRFLGDEGSSQSGTLLVWVPPFATKLTIGAMGSGQGELVFDTTYKIQLSNNGSVSAGADALATSGFFWGPSEADGLTITGTGSGTPVITAITYTKPADLKVASLVFRWSRTSTTIG